MQGRMHRAPDACRPGCRRFLPHARMYPEERSSTLVRVPPRARGCTILLRVFAFQRVGSSLRAKMYRISPTSPTTSRRFLLAREDAPHGETGRPEIPLRARGCTRSGRSVARWGGFRPAHYGTPPHIASMHRPAHYGTPPPPRIMALLRPRALWHSPAPAHYGTPPPPRIMALLRASRACVGPLQRRGSIGV
jgi:hypothetical protein